ncbi:hypothetical protein [Streptomyces sp. 2A115]|uniref:hypothetical protein n=1 Tax=Streptomyces sp. 2A115 TaxID=3457439 RepID=UPI003FCF87A8
MQFLGVAVGGLALSTGGPVAIPALSALIACGSLLTMRRTAPDTGSRGARDDPAVITAQE